MRAKASRTPAATSTDSSDVPPCDMNGRGTPSTGKTRSTTPMLMSAWPTIQTVMPPAAMRTNGSSVLRITWNAPTANSANSVSTTAQPMRPSSSPTMAKM